LINSLSITPIYLYFLHDEQKTTKNAFIINSYVGNFGVALCEGKDLVKEGNLT